MNFFSKSSKKPKKTTTSTTTTASDEDTHSLHSNHSGSRSPQKKSSSAKSGKARDENSKAEQGSSRSHRSSRRTGRHSPRHTIDPDEHPLNWPPEQRSSVLSTMSDTTPMDVDSEPPNAPSSPSPQSNRPSAFDVPSTNGIKPNGEPQVFGPAPPPHKTPTSPPAPPAPTLEDAEAFKATGNKLYKAGDYRKAIVEYTKAVEAQPSSPTYLNNRAAAYIGSGQYVNALDDCLRADELDPNNAKILLRLARIYTSLGRPQEALDTYARIRPAPSAKDVAPAKAMLQHIQVAEEALKNGTTGSMALHALDQADKLLGPSALKPRKWQLMRGEAYLKMGNVNALGDAQNVAMGLLRYNNKDPEALVLRGRALYSQGDNPKAIQHFRSALEWDPDYQAAFKYLRMVQKLDRMKAEGNADYKASRWQQAIDKYTDALEVDPTNKGTNSKLLQNRALCRVQLKDYQGAIEDCERAIVLDPSYTKAKKTKANALGQCGKWEDAVRELKELAEQDPNDPTLAKEVRKAELELKKSKRKDYYKILGIEKEADEHQIKKAYRKAALIHHPDKNPGDNDAEQRFKDITEAHETLSDPEKRARYDRGEDLMDPMEAFGGSGMGGGMQIDPEILMQMMGAQMGGGRGGGGFHSFGGGMPGGMGGGGGRRGAPQGFPGGFSFQ